MTRRFILALAALAFLAARGWAMESDELRAEVLLSHDRLAPGHAFRAAVVIDLSSPWHINANPASEAMIPTAVTWSGPAPVSIERVDYPAGKAMAVDWAEEPVSLYESRVVIVTEGRVAADAPLGPARLEATVRYQACNDTVCLAPKTISLAVETEISDATPQPAHAEIFDAAPPPPSAAPAGPTNTVEQLIAERGWLIAVVFVFLGGLALNLTPCVYPMIAITVSYFGGREGRTRGQALAGAVVYCAGIVVTYTALGVAAALTGGLFGALLQSPVVLAGIALLLVVLALSMFGLFEIRPPQFLVQRAAGMSARAGSLGVFFLGATIGIIAAPCLAPFVVALLAYVGATRQWWWFLVFSCGLALPYVVLGTFSGLLTRLPKSGTWMVWVKRVFGVALIAVAVWFVWPVWGPKSSASSPIAWQVYAPELLRDPGTPVLLDFYAEWCIPCHEMDKRTFTDAGVIEASKNFRMLKVDLTRTGSPEVEKLTKEFRVVGVPTYAFFTSDGRELTQLRQIGFVPADQFLRVMEQARTETNVAGTVVGPAADIPAQLLRPF
jgi:thiol:disulfide interchange protein DsbD